jgi:putative SOS response-associated peptidase YedK
MCATYTPPKPGEIRIRMRALEPTFDYPARVWPGLDGPMLIRHDQTLTPHRARFGLVPYFAKQLKQRYSTYNARSEDIASRASFRGPWRERKFCLIPMQRFFEPNYESGKAVWWGIERIDGEPFNVAAIWDRWRSGTGETVLSYSLLTVNAGHHPLMQRFHAPGDEKRSVVALDEQGSDRWLSADSDLGARELLTLFPADEFRSAPATELE